MKKWELQKKVEVTIKGHVQSRKDFERLTFVSHISDRNELKYRGIVHHPHGRMEWQWCRTLKEAKDWVRRTINQYGLYEGLE